VYAAICLLSSMTRDLMSVVTCQSLIGERCVSVDCCASGCTLADFLLRCFAFAGVSDRSANLSAAFQHAEDSGLIGSAITSDATLAFATVHVPRLAADESFAYFDFAAELGTEKIILHRKANPMEHKPCGLLGYLHISRNFIARDAILAIGEQPRYGEPFIQADRRILNDGADLDGELALGMVSGARPSAAIGTVFNLRGTACRTDDLPVPPSANGEVVDAIVRIREMDDCFLQTLGFGHGLVLHDLNSTEGPWWSQLCYWQKFSLSVFKIGMNSALNPFCVDAVGFDGPQFLPSHKDSTL